MRTRTVILVAVTAILILTNNTFAIDGDMGLTTEPLTDGSAEYPYLIEDFEDFKVFCNDCNCWEAGIHTQLDCNLDLATNLPGRQIYTMAPIAGDTEAGPPFNGSTYGGYFDGSNHVIYNLTINGNAYCGLFGETDPNSKIKNLGIENASITSSDNYTGFLVGKNASKIINKCYSTGTANGNYHVGGLVGWNECGRISNCYSSSTVNGSGNTGGLIGFNASGIINNCYSNSSVDGANDKIGGLVGYNCGGIINNCYSNGTNSGNDYVGGLVGKNDTGMINKCYSNSTVTGTNYIGNIAGLHYYGNIKDCFWNIETSGLDIAYTDENGTYISYNYDTIYSTEGVAVSKTTEEMKNLNIFTDAGWNFTDDQTGKICDWYMPNNNYPLLRWQNNTDITMVPDIKGLPLSKTQTRLQTAGLVINNIIDVNSFTIPVNHVAGISIIQGDMYLNSSIVDIFVSIGSVADGTEQKPYEVASQQDLEHVNDNLDACYIMTSDIYMTDRYTTSVISPGSSYYDKFTGIFNGNYHIINNLIIDQGNYLAGTTPPLPGNSTPITYRPLGLFGKSANSNIKNLGIKNASINSLYCNVGCLIGENGGDITNCYCSSSNVNGYGRVAGLVGKNGGNTSCCYSDASVIGSGSIGCLVGYNSFNNINNCYSKGSVSGDGSMGGLVGRNYHGDISNCYSSCTINGSGDYVRGLMGTAGYGGSVSACYWDFEASEMSTYYYDELAKTTEEMQSLSTFTEVGWDFVGEDINGGEDVWRMCLDGVDYPRLWWEFGGGDFVCGDGVDMADFAVLANSWYLSAGDGGYNDRCDLVNDDFVGFDDLGVFAEQWLEGGN